MAFPTTKSSLTHTWTKDTRDRVFLGSRGSLLKMTHVGVNWRRRLTDRNTLACLALPLQRISSNRLLKVSFRVQSLAIQVV